MSRANIWKLIIISLLVLIFFYQISINNKLQNLNNKLQKLDEKLFGIAPRLPSVFGILDEIDSKLNKIIK